MDNTDIPPAHDAPDASTTAPPASVGTTPADGVARPLDPADGITRPLDPRWVPYQRRVVAARSLVRAAMFTGAALLAVAGFEMPIIPVAVTTVAVFIAWTGVALWWPGVQYRYMSYRLDRRALEIRRGVLWRSVIVVPRSRIQHSDVSQGPLERMHELGTLSVYTAGTRYALVRLHGLAHERALAIREHLLQSDDDDVV